MPLRVPLSRNHALLLLAGLLIGIGASLILLCSLDVLPLFGCNQSPSQGIAPAVPELDQPAPSFSLADLSGTQVNIRDFQGKALLINFWATWCGPCRLEMPVFEQYQVRYEEDLTILAVNYGETQQQVQTFMDELKLEHLRVLLDPQTVVGDLYRVRAFPTTYFLDQDGRIRYQHIGYLSEAQLVGYLDELGVAE